VPPFPELSRSPQFPVWGSNIGPDVPILTVREWALMLSGLCVILFGGHGGLGKGSTECCVG